VVENEMKINPCKSKALSFTRTCVKDPLNYSFKDQRIPEASCCKYLGIIMQSVTYRKIWKTTNRTHVQNIGKYLDIVKNKWFNTIKDM
jgi:hypothetical protein